MGDSRTYAVLNKLVEHFPTILCEDEVDMYRQEVSRLQIDTYLPNSKNADGTDMRLDHWWALLFKTTKYPKVEKVIKAVLSILSICGKHVSHLHQLELLLYSVEKTSQFCLHQHEGKKASSWVHILMEQLFYAARHLGLCILAFSGCWVCMYPTQHLL